MRGRYRRRSRDVDAAGAPPLPGADSPAAGGAVQDSDGGTEGGKFLTYGGEKTYLGVRVKMPVKDLLRNVRLAQGWNPEDFQENFDKRSKGDKKRVKTCKERRTSKKRLSKSLEELAIIVEVLEEDLKTGHTLSPSPQTGSLSKPPVLPPCSPESLRGSEPYTYSYTATYSCSLQYDSDRQTPDTSDGQLTGVSLSNEYDNSFHSPQTQGYNSDESDDMIPSPQSYMTCSPGTPEGLLMSPDFTGSSLQSPEADPHRDGTIDGVGGEGVCWPGQWQWSSSAFFGSQLQREESQLRDVPDSVLLHTNPQGRTALHEVACVGKRALGYAIAKRMAALHSLDLKDSEGMTALHLAAKHNHHLMVGDLIQLGATINERNNSGKSCLHLSAESGYIRVLEVLRLMMSDGVYVDAEATDVHGRSALQCASAALNHTLHKLESCASAGDTRLFTLRKEQLMETLECLLQMGGFMYTMGCGYAENVFDVAYQPLPVRSAYPILHEGGEPHYAT
ncbi:uncharacterized protein LOC142990702 isoform X2 [Genypterus blacodes]|uniref:uncharacterized protein LOC142990702 isoform X2 n=1 Tax=Genypterus blacodes TaxID=154954 RepID=UPI003F759408